MRTILLDLNWCYYQAMLQECEHIQKPKTASWFISRSYVKNTFKMYAKYKR